MWMDKQTDNTLLGLFLCLRLTTSNQKSSLAHLILVYLINSKYLILMQDFHFTLINHHLPMGCNYLSSTERRSFVPLEQISLPPVSCSLPLLSHLLSPLFISNSLPSIPLMQRNLLCAENFTLGILSRYVFLSYTVPFFLRHGLTI